VAASSFSEALVRGLGCPNPSSLSVSENQGHDSSSPSHPPFSLSSLCLLGKPWGDPIPLSIIMSKTRKDWGFVKGQLDYLELGNGWILFRFSNLQDITLVWNGRPWHVSGLNLVLRKWEPYFDPYSATIQRIDQWVKITHLPLELWEEEALRQLLKDVGVFIKVDDITLNRSKGKFARVCLNIDISKPLRGSLFLPVPNKVQPLEVPISYEGLHEVCAWCGSNAHALDACPETPKGPLEVIVEKFGATKLQHVDDSESQKIPPPTPLAEKWVTVSPKKRGRTLPLARKKSSSKLSSTPAPPSVKVVSTVPSPAMVNTACPNPANMGGSPPFHATGGVMASPAAPDPSMVQAAPFDAPTALDEPGLRSAGLAEPIQSAAPSPGEMARFSPSNSQQYAPSPSSPLTGSPLEEEDVDMFLNLEEDEAVQLSTESAKKRKLVPGEASSPSYSTS